MKKPWEIEFKRKFAVNFCKNKKFKLAEMSFYKDFVNDRRGDMYPLLAAGEEEKVERGHYFARGGAERFFTALFPYASYEMTFAALEGACGFHFQTPLGDAKLLLSHENDTLSLLFGEERFALSRRFASGMTLLVTMRKNNFEVYLRDGDMPEFITEFRSDALDGIHFEKAFRASHVCVLTLGKSELKAVESHMDSGLSQADIRPVKYENGDIMIENGKMYFTLTVRTHEEKHQAVFSWIPGTAEFEMTGAVFFDSGDGAWCPDVATSLKFNRKTGKWLLWVCSFDHDHILGHAEFDGDIRFGLNVVDITLLPKADETNTLHDLVGFWGDEDPDFLYDETRGVWVFAVCRLMQSADKRSYGYYIFEGDSPFSYDRFIGCAENGEETGGSLIFLDGALHLVCGNSFRKRANYRVYTLPDMKAFHELHFDYDDGGFRGWGTLVPIKCGTRTRLFHLTFDRHNSSSYNWSYGNLYCFEA